MRIGSIQWGAGLFSALAGAMMLLTPHRFQSLVYDPLRPNLPLWGLAFLLLGVVLILVAVMTPPRPVVAVSHLAVGVALLSLSSGLFTAQSWSGAVSFAVLGLVTLLAPVLAQIWDTRAPPEGNLLAVALGVAAVLNGLIHLLFPDQFAGPVFDSYRSILVWQGLAFLLGGVALLYAQLRPLPRPLSIGAHVLGGGALLLFFAVSSVPLDAWLGILYYGGFGLLIVLLPWVDVRLRSIDLTALQTRLAVALAISISLPLVLGLTLYNELDLLSEPERHNLTFLYLLTIIALSFVAGAYVARWLASPLNSLTSAIDRFAAGDVSTPLPAASGITQIDLLAGAFGGLRESLSRQAEERESLLNELRGANEQLTHANLRGQEQAQEAHRRALELDAIISAIPDAILIGGPRGEVIRLDPAAESLLGYSEKQLAMSLEQRLAQLWIEDLQGRRLSAEEAPSLRVRYGETIRDQAVIWHRSPDEQIWLSISGAPVMLGEGLAGMVLTMRDVTTLHRLQEQREDFIRTVSHDLRNPLTVVSSHAQLLSRALTEQEPTMERERNSVQTILTSVQRMNSMILDLVESVRMESGQLQVELQPTDLVGLLSEISQRVGTPEQQPRIRLEPVELVPPVLADPLRLERAVTNLLTNALKYSPPGSPVLLRVQKQGNEDVISVSDQGAGIPVEEQEHLFERFYRARSGRRAEGLGLGLYITRLIAEAHGGRVWVESQPGQGSTFYIALPLEQ